MFQIMATSYAYVFTKSNGESVEVSLKEGFLPPIFFEYLTKASLTEEEFAHCEVLKKELGNRA